MNATNYQTQSYLDYVQRQEKGTLYKIHIVALIVFAIIAAIGYYFSNGPVFPLVGLAGFLASLYFYHNYKNIEVTERNRRLLIKEKDTLRILAAVNDFICAEGRSEEERKALERAYFEVKAWTNYISRKPTKTEELYNIRFDFIDSNGKVLSFNMPCYEKKDSHKGS